MIIVDMRETGIGTQKMSFFRCGFGFRVQTQFHIRISEIPIRFQHTNSVFLSFGFEIGWAFRKFECEIEFTP